jgi:hypothetical protein
MAQQRGIAQAPATAGQINEVIHLLQMSLPSPGQLREMAIRCCSDKDSAQMLIERAGELKAVRKFFSDLAKELSNSPLHAEQVTNSSIGYSGGYRKARFVHEQIAILKNYDWGRKVDWNFNELQLQLLRKPAPLGSDGYFVGVFHESMVTHFEENPGVDQSIPLALALNALSKQRDGRVVNYCEGKLGPEYYRRSKQSVQKMQELWESQGRPSGVILIPAQFGIEYRGMSVLRSRVLIRGSEFPLDGPEVVMMLLTHPDRMSCEEDLWLDLPASEYSLDCNGVFDHALSLQLIDQQVYLDVRTYGTQSRDYGSVSGFLPDSN